jgi:N-acetylmuramoyl-L-alanine amidase
MKIFKKILAAIFIVSIVTALFFFNNITALFSSLNKKITSIGIDNIEFKQDNKIHIVIDAGHGGPDVGAINFKQHIYEKNITRKMVDAFVAMVDTSKYTLLQTRPLDSNIHRHHRIVMANKFKPDLLLSFHCNSFTNTSWNGIEVHISDSSLNYPDTTSKINPHKQVNWGIADTLMKNIAAAFPDMKRGKIISRKDRIWIIYAGNFPSVLVEWGYISNPNDIEIMKDPVAQEVFARAVWQSVDEHFRLGK